MAHFDHVIVGGGVAGMTTALLLAKAGNRVAIAESFPMLAPTIAGFRRKGVYFETGLHYLGGLADGHPMDVYFKHLGLADSIVKVPYDQSGFDRVVFGENGRHFDIPSGFASLKARFSEQFPDDAECVDQFFSAIEDKLSSTPFLNFNKEFDLNYLMDGGGSWETLDEFLAARTDNDELKFLLTAHTLLYGVPPRDATLETHALVSGTYYLSAHTIEGGGRALVKAYKQQLDDLGVQCFCGQPVKTIHITKEREIESVELADGVVLETESVVWTAHPGGLADATPDHAFRPAFRKRLAALEDTPSALMLFGISDKPIPGLNGRNMFLVPEKEYTNDWVLTEQAIYLSASLDPKSGKTAVTAIQSNDIESYEEWKESNLKNRPVNYELYKTAKLAVMEQDIYRCAPELKDVVDFIEGATPLTIRDYCQCPTGGLYGARQSVDQFNPTPVTKVPGLKLAGQSMIAPGILGAIVSAYITVGIISGHEELHKDLRRHACNE